MSVIRVLPEHVANQIAAGEVIERPASVVKELLENTMDAEASQVSIQVEGNGTRLIKVIDNGYGMDQDDVLLCLERHATSTLVDEQGLNAITSFGFRGEAIPSIASVSRFAITSRRNDSELGTHADVRYGRVVKVHEMGCAAGTTMEVRDLFGNVPARRKFLKSVRTELSHIEDVVRSFALARPELGCELVVNDRIAFSLPAGNDTLARRLNLFNGRTAAAGFVAIGSPSDKIPPGLCSDIMLHGLLVPPEESAPSYRLRIFGNGRAVADRMIAHAVYEGMQGFLLKGRRPAGVLFVDLDPALVDVNVHPAKQEVRFREADRVHRLVMENVRSAFVGAQELYRSSLFAVPDPAAREQASALPITAAEQGPGPVGPSWPKDLPQPSFSAEPKPLYAKNRGLHAGAVISFPATSLYSPVLLKNRTGSADDKGTEEMVAQDVEACVPEGVGDQEVGSLRIIGQLLNTYILCEGEEGMLLIDQHAAHERLLFEGLKRRYAEKTLATQSLLFPMVFEAGPAEMSILEQYSEELAHLGLVVEGFGGSSYAVKGVPAALGKASPEEVLAGVFERLSADSTRHPHSRADRMDDLLSMIACKAAVKAGDRLQPEEMARLLEQMQEADIFSHCPHGRPVMRFVEEREIRKWFSRT